MATHVGKQELETRMANHQNHNTAFRLIVGAAGGHPTKFSRNLIPHDNTHPTHQARGIVNLGHARLVPLATQLVGGRRKRGREGTLGRRMGKQ